jgi:hypothetical protein
MRYRLLVDLEAIAILDSMPRKARSRMLDHFANLRSAPDRYSDHQERDAVGRRIEISIFTGRAIHYWIDFPDRHVKILAIKTIANKFG